ncbi:hypothetical protein Sjap_019162 [Stephania japonica]|uniref:Uncharacterized protein n=1 Tax=Stephania japonica TaxID=461633 RepID=A0AAP0HUG7_9MAGN
MASSSLLSFRPPGVVASATSGHRKPVHVGRTVRPQPASWWTPIFGYSADPDYIDENSSGGGSTTEKSRIWLPEAESDGARSRSRFAPGCFTEDKARQLRMKSAETYNFHDVMYHSAIASRLASDLSDRLHIRALFCAFVRVYAWQRLQAEVRRMEDEEDDGGWRVADEEDDAMNVCKAAIGSEPKQEEDDGSGG